MREIVVDTETTGLDHKSGDRIIEVACVELNNHITTGNILQFYCSTDKLISEEATSIHGLTNDFLSQYPGFSENVEKLLDFIKEDTLVIHNAEFDLGFINNELELLKIKPLKNNHIDTVKLARKKLNTKTANLNYLCNRFSIDLSERKLHGALKDCQLLTGVYLELLGGRQTTMMLVEGSENKTNNKGKNKAKRGKIHEIKISFEERKQHKDFILGLKTPIWRKIDY